MTGKKRTTKGGMEERVSSRYVQASKQACGRTGRQKEQSYSSVTYQGWFARDVKRQVQRTCMCITAYAKSGQSSITM